MQRSLPDTIHTMTSHEKNSLTTYISVSKTPLDRTVQPEEETLFEKAVEWGSAEIVEWRALIKRFRSKADRSQANVQTGPVSLPASENMDPEASWGAGNKP